MSYPRAIGRALALAALALVSWLDVLVELIAFCLLCVGLVFFLGPTVEWTRHRSGVMRRLAGRWGDIDIPAPYQPEPPEPVRERDGWYRDGNQLYKRAFWIRWQRRLTWALEDPAAQREFSWQLVNPLATLALPIAAVFAGPAALRGYGRWTRWWIGTRPAPGAVGMVRRPFRWIHLRLESLGHLMGIFALSVVLLLFTLWPAALLVVLPPAAAPVIVWSRVIANTLRREVGNWTGVRIPRPYLPPPPLPVPRADGLFRVGKQLYEEPWWPVQQARMRWVMRDRATWRDLAAGAANPLVSLALTLVPFVLTFWGFLGLLALWVWRPITLWWPLPGSQWFAMVGLPEASTNLDALALTPVALAALFAGLYPTKWLARQSGLFARLLLGPTESSRLAQRVQRLAQTRSDALDTQAAELRRIDATCTTAAQARLVAMGMDLGTIEPARQGPAQAAACWRRRGSRPQALTELRDLVRGIDPPVLAERGLRGRRKGAGAAAAR